MSFGAYLLEMLERIWNSQSTLQALASLATIVAGIFGILRGAVWLRGMIIPEETQRKLDPDIPVPRSDWVRRDGDLDKVRQYFFPTRADDPATAGRARLVLVHAHGGFGKSTLAAYFARKFADRFAEVWWISSEFGSDLMMKLSEVDFQPKKKPVLYVFDNVSEETKINVAKRVGKLPPNACVLITSRTADWLPSARQVELRGLDVPAAAEFLRKLAQSDDIDGSERLARALGGQPLVLVQAGTRCRQSNLSFHEYWKDIDRNLQQASPPDAEYDKTEYAVVKESLDHIAGSKAATRLADFLAYCAADRIPRSLYRQAINDPDPTSLNDAVQALRDVALVSNANAFQDGESALSMHRVVQMVIRYEVKGNDPECGAEVISYLLTFLYDLLLSTKAANKDLSFSKYLPHLLQVLRHLEEPAFRGSDKGDILDAAVEQVVLHLATVMEAATDDVKDDMIKEYVPDLPRLIGRFYQVAPLCKLLNVLLQRIQVPSILWRDFRDECLAADNYVLRYALADALAGRAQSNALGRTMREIEDLLTQPKTLNHFELGGYALKSVYSEMADKGFLSRLVEGLLASVRRTRDTRVDTALLSCLANHVCYPGRSILGDLMLNLAHQGKSPRRLLPPEEGQNDRFWRPTWDFVDYDVNAIYAAEHLNSKTPLPAKAELEYHYLRQLKAWRAELVSRLEDVPDVCDIVQDYFAIGTKPDKITAKSAKLQFRKLANAEFRGREPSLFSDALRLLFGHPLWSVAEAAASVIAELVREAAKDGREQEKKAYLDAIESLFDEPHWRVRYGAMEAAYQIRLDETVTMTTFAKGVKLFYNDRVSKLRGLCAENLFSVMLNASDQRRKRWETEFDDQIRHWLRDEDCWVLDHIHRYFHTLHLRGATAPILTNAECSQLFEGLDDWWRYDREAFLKHIETRKNRLVEMRTNALAT